MTVTTEDLAFAVSLREQDQSLIIRDTLHLLPIAEFLILTEVTEIIVPVVYCMCTLGVKGGLSLLLPLSYVNLVTAIYLMAAFHLSNRMYYPNLHYTTQEQLNETVWHVMIYAALELFSFIMLAFILQR